MKHKQDYKQNNERRFPTERHSSANITSSKAPTGQSAWPLLSTLWVRMKWRFFQATWKVERRGTRFIGK